MTPSLATAQERVLVVRASAGDREAARGLAERVRDGLAARGIAVELPPTDEEPEDPRIALEQAQQDYYELRAEAAARRLESWLERAESSGGRGLDRPTWIEGLAWLARARLAVGDEPGADAALDRLCAVDPTFILDPATHPPPLRERAAARCRGSEARVVTLRLEVRPRGARVLVDGAEASSETLDLPVGLHLVRAEAPGHHGRGRVVAVTPDTRAIELSLPVDAEGALSAPREPGTSVEPLRRGARATGRSLTLVDARRVDTGWLLALHDEASDRRARAGPEAGRGAAVRALLASWDLAAAPAPRPPEDGEDPWPWIAVGSAGAVAAAVAIGLAVGFTTASGGLSAVGGRAP